MTEYRISWLKTAEDALSYRRMCDLAVEIAGSDAASYDLQRCAARVVRALADVVDLPIADAKVLLKARRKFKKLEKALIEQDSIEV